MVTQRLVCGWLVVAFNVKLIMLLLPPPLEYYTMPFHVEMGQQITLLLLKNWYCVSVSVRLLVSLSYYIVELLLMHGMLVWRKQWHVEGLYINLISVIIKCNKME